MAVNSKSSLRDVALNKMDGVIPYQEPAQDKGRTQLKKSAFAKYANE